MEHLCRAAEGALSTSNWYAALMVALALPDIAARVDDPSKKSGTRYSDWVERYLSPTYTRLIGAPPRSHKFLGGGDCYALRCAFLHEGGDDVSHHSAVQALERFQFLAPRPGWMIHMNQSNAKLQLQVDVFCTDVVNAVRSWRASIPDSDSARLDRLAQLAAIQTEGPILI